MWGHPCNVPTPRDLQDDMDDALRGSSDDDDWDDKEKDDTIYQTYVENNLSYVFGVFSEEDVVQAGEELTLVTRYSRDGVTLQFALERAAKAE